MYASMVWQILGSKHDLNCNSLYDLVRICLKIMASAPRARSRSPAMAAGSPVTRVDQFCHLAEVLSRASTLQKLLSCTEGILLEVSECLEERDHPSFEEWDRRVTALLSEIRSLRDDACQVGNQARRILTTNDPALEWQIPESVPVVETSDD